VHLGVLGAARVPPAQGTRLPARLGPPPRARRRGRRLGAARAAPGREPPDPDVRVLVRRRGHDVRASRPRARQRGARARAHWTAGRPAAGRVMGAASPRRVVMHLEGLPIGGGTITAIELGGVLHADLGWDVVVCAAPGPATAMLEERGHRYAPAPAGAGGTGAARVRALVEVCARESPALVHAWDWRAIHTAHVGPWLVRGTPVLGTITEMQVPPGLPAGTHVKAVTEDLSRQNADPARVHVLDPPVNDVLDDPAVVDDRAFRTEHFSPVRAVHIVVVSRLARAMKAEGIHQAIDAVALLPEHLAAELVIVGDGDAEDDLRHAAAAAEARAGRALVRFAGPMLDPRAAYKAADIVVGMGTSAARALAFGRPVVVVGEGGFCRTFAPGTAAQLIGAGFYGTAPFR